MTERSSSSTLRGILWMIVTGLMFVGVTSLVKYLGPDMPAAEAAFLRYALGSDAGVGFQKRLFSAVDAAFCVSRRGACGGGVFMVFCDGADSFGGCNGDELPIADLCDVGGGVIFGRKTGVAAGDRRRHCVGGGLDYFAPRYSQRGYGASGDAVGCGIFCLLLFVNQTAQAPMAWMVWVPPSTNDLLILFGVACFATLGHYTMTLAFAAAPVNITQPVTFLQLVWAVSVGMVFFDEPLDPWVVIGGGTILASVSFISWREAVLQRRLRTPPVPATKV